MAVNLSMDLLRSFVAIDDMGSILQTTEQVFVIPIGAQLADAAPGQVIRQPVFRRCGR